MSTPFKLVVVSGADEGRAFPLQGAVFGIGRQESNDLQLLEPSVSRRHAEIREADNGFELVDLGSAHGCFVNGSAVARRFLEHGDFIQVGSTGLIFLRESDGSVPGTGPREGLLAVSTLEKRPEEIARLVIEGQRNAEADLALLLKISQAIQEIRGRDALAERLLDLLLDALPADRAAFLLPPFDDAPLATRGQGPPHVSRTALDRVVDAGVALLWQDVSRDPSLGQAASLPQIDVRSLLAVPLQDRRELHGVLYFQSAQAQALTETHLELVAAAARFASVAFDTARLFDDLRRENRRLRGNDVELGMVGQSPAMDKLRGFLQRVAPVDSTVLLRGESGTGKELAASSLHRASPRADQPFVAINCATLSETLLESELFGHEKGAFTGALNRKIGKFEAADGGTLFLDEVGEIPPNLQARLLRALQERQIDRLGGSRPIAVDVRVIAATNRDLESSIREGTFREDLYYRLNVIAFTLPSLRERRPDIPLLARHFIRLHGERLKRRGVGLDPSALAVMSRYPWPGNIRELSNAVERALVLGDGEMIRPEDLPDEMLDSGVEQEVPLGDFQTTLTETKKRLLLDALERTGGNAAAAARELGLHPNSFRRLMRRLGLKES